MSADVTLSANLLHSMKYNATYNAKVNINMVFISKRESNDCSGKSDSVSSPPTPTPPPLPVMFSSLMWIISEDKQNKSRTWGACHVKGTPD